MESVSGFHVPVQAIYDYVYNNHKPKKKQGEIRSKQVELRNTKTSFHVDYKLMGNYYSLC